jgi:poly(3-hydroxybutyrate) depolymerase
MNTRQLRSKVKNVIVPVLRLLVLLLFIITIAESNAGQPASPGRHKISFTSSFDGTAQPAYLIIPKKYSSKGPGVALVVALHTWSATLDQRDMFGELEREAGKRGWLCLFPDFRGSSDHPLGCGSDAACCDVLDAVDWTMARYTIDKKSVYLAGFSGGAFMTMLLIARFPERWTAASAWGGISDLKAWYAFQVRHHYSADMRNCFGGAPGESTEISQRYEERSPVNRLSAAGDFPIDLVAGRGDGHGADPVPIAQTIGAFNAIAQALGANRISEEEMRELSPYSGALLNPQPQDTAADAIFKRKIMLRRTAGAARITIFDGRHEWIPRAVMTWFDHHPGKQ